MQHWLDLISPCLRIANDSATRLGWVEPLRVIYDHELVLFREGQCIVEIDGQSFDCSADTFLIVPPGRWHLSKNVGGGRAYRCWVHFDWVYQGESTGLPVMTFHPARPSPDLYHLAPDIVPTRVLHGAINSPTAAFDLHERLTARWKQGTTHARATCRGLLLELLIELLHEPSAKPAHENRGSRLASKARELLAELSNTPCGNAPPIQSSLRGLGFTYAHVCRQFKQEYGITPLAYVNASRLERAKLLLKDTELTISEVAAKVGFDSLSYFSRLFSKKVGHPPTTFRQMNG